MDWRKLFLNNESKDTGFRIGFVAILFIVITAVFPTLTGLEIDNPTVRNFMDIFQIGLLMTIFFAFWLRSNRKKKGKPENYTPMELGLKNIGKQGSVVMLGVMAGVVLVILNYVVLAGSNLLLDVSTGTVDMNALYLGLLAGVAEELFFRGFIQTFLRIYAPGVLFAVIPSALIFTIYHLVRYNDPAMLVVIFVLGLYLGLLHEMSDDIGVPILAHVINNTYAMLPLVLIVVLANMSYVFIIGVMAVVTYLFGIKMATSGGSRSGKKGRVRGRK